LLFLSKFIVFGRLRGSIHTSVELGPVVNSTNLRAGYIAWWRR